MAITISFGLFVTFQIHTFFVAIEGDIAFVHANTVTTGADLTLIDRLSDSGFCVDSLTSPQISDDAARAAQKTDRVLCAAMWKARWKGSLAPRMLDSIAIELVLLGIVLESLARLFRSPSPDEEASSDHSRIVAHVERAGAKILLVGIAAELLLNLLAGLGWLEPIGLAAHVSWVGNRGAHATAIVAFAVVWVWLVWRLYRGIGAAILLRRA
jgi:hypothetical protein